MIGEPFLGEIRRWQDAAPPQGWAWCDGSLLAITEHPALFAAIGAEFGGDGVLTFALPLLQATDAPGGVTDKAARAARMRLGMPAHGPEGNAERTSYIIAVAEDAPVPPAADPPAGLPTQDHRVD